MGKKKRNQDISSIQKKYFMYNWGVQNEYEPIAVKKTDGCWIYTEDGRKIFDLRSAHECINLGFRHSRVIEAMTKQMESVIYVTDDFATEPAALLAQKLAVLTPGDPGKKVWFCQSGAAANEAAIMGARFYKYNKLFKGDSPVKSKQYPYPFKIITRYRSYHGSTTAAMSASGDPRRWAIEPFTMSGVRHAPDAYCYRCPFNKTYPDCEIECALYIDQMIEFEGGRDKVAAIMIEPVVGSNGIIPPPPEYFPLLREICDKWDILLIVDEVMTGMGRTGKLFAIEHYGVVPDIIVMGKALGVYCPLAATIFSKEISSSFDENQFCHGQSYSGHALACAAGLASIDALISDNILNNANIMGKYLGDQLLKMYDRHPSVGEVRGIGLFWTLELVRNRKTREPFRSPTQKFADNVIHRIADFLLKERNIYIPRDKFGLWVVPPLIINKQETDFLIEAIDDALSIADSETTRS